MELKVAVPLNVVAPEKVVAGVMVKVVTVVGKRLKEDWFDAMVVPFTKSFPPVVISEEQLSDPLLFVIVQPESPLPPAIYTSPVPDEPIFIAPVPLPFKDIPVFVVDG